MVAALGPCQLLDLLPDLVPPAIPFALTTLVSVFEPQNLHAAHADNIPVAQIAREQVLLSQKSHVLFLVWAARLVLEHSGGLLLDAGGCGRGRAQDLAWFDEDSIVFDNLGGPFLDRKHGSVCSGNEHPYIAFVIAATLMVNALPVG